jgi:hypothetical protein
VRDKNIDRRGEKERGKKRILKIKSAEFFWAL